MFSLEICLENRSFGLLPASEQHLPGGETMCQTSLAAGARLVALVPLFFTSTTTTTTTTNDNDNDLGQADIPVH